MYTRKKIELKFVTFVIREIFFNLFDKRGREDDVKIHMRGIFIISNHKKITKNCPELIKDIINLENLNLNALVKY